MIRNKSWGQGAWGPRAPLYPLQLQESESAQDTGYMNQNSQWVLRKINVIHTLQLRQPDMFIDLLVVQMNKCCLLRKEMKFKLYLQSGLNKLSSHLWKHS